MEDIFRKKYQKLSDDQQAAVELFKMKADDLIKSFYEAGFLNPNKTCMDLAIQRLQEAVMWAIKSIT